MDTEVKTEKTEVKVEAKKVGIGISIRKPRFDKMYASDKAKKFIYHLTGAVSYPAKILKIFEWEPKYNKRTCSLCNRPLMSMVETLHKLEEGWETHFKELGEKKELKEQLIKADVVDLEKIKELQDVNLFPNPTRVFKQARLAFSTNRTDAVFCLPCLNDFKEWLVGQLVTSIGKEDHDLSMIAQRNIKKAFQPDSYEAKQNLVDKPIERPITKPLKPYVKYEKPKVEEKPADKPFTCNPFSQLKELWGSNEKMD
jgi:hypothetical protein